MSYVPKAPFSQRESAPFPAWKHTAINYGRETPQTDRQTSKSPKRQMNAQPNEKVDDEVCAESEPKPPFLPFLQSSIQRLTEQRSNHKMDITVGSLALEHSKVHTVP